MSKTNNPNHGEQVEQFKENVRETFAPEMGTLQALDAKGIPPDERGFQENKNTDGEEIYKRFEMRPFFRELQRASKMDHSVGEHPQAVAHLLAHVRNGEKYELKQEDPYLEDLPRTRRHTLEWFHAAPDDRMDRLRTGGTDLLIHGEQGTTKSTFILWLMLTILQVNPSENIVYQASLDDTEWLTLGPWTTVALPTGVDVEVEADPYSRRLSLGSNNISLEMTDLCREIIRYVDPEDLAEKIADRTPGQIYAVYPDPKFRGCQRITGWNYRSLWDVDDPTEATPIEHFWFAILEELVHGTAYNEWTSLIADEAQKYLHQRASKDDHDWWSKIQDWATTYGDARKANLSAFLACHQIKEIHASVRDKIRWGATMNGEDFPEEAPLDGSNVDQSLGETVVWSSQKWNKIGYEDLKHYISVPADVHVRYPTVERLEDPNQHAQEVEA